MSVCGPKLILYLTKVGPPYYINVEKYLDLNT